MNSKKSNTTTVVIITILIMLVIGLIIFIAIDKLSKKDEKSTGNNTENTSTTTEKKQDDNNKMIENTQNNQNKETNTNIIPSEEEIRNIIIEWMLKQENVVDAKIDKISLDENTEELKDMIHVDHSEILVYAQMKVIKEGNGYSRADGWLAYNHELCHLIPNANGKYEVKSCASGW